MAKSRLRNMRKKKETPTSTDPFHLDGGPYARTLHRIEQDFIALKRSVPNEPRHPLLKDRAVAVLVRHLEKFERGLDSRGSHMHLGDAYYEFNEGMVLRLPVLVKVILDYVRKHPEVRKRTQKRKG